MMDVRYSLLRTTPLALLSALGCGGDDGTDEGGSTAPTDGATSSATDQGSGPGPSGPTETGPGASGDTGPGGATADDTAGTSDDAGTGEPVPPTGFEGWGAMTQGADSCPQTPDEIHVTTLADAGPGSLREALSDGCRRIVFDVGGTITLQSDLNLPYSYVTIDGATAPDPGITIVQPGVIGTTIEASGSIGPIRDVILTHLRMDGQAVDHANEGDIWGIDGEAAPVSNVILDHITAIGATDGVFDMWEDVSNVTVSWCLVADTVAALHLSTGDIAVARDRVSFHHNVFAGNNERQIRIRHASTDIDYRNNVVYGWGWFEGGAAGLHIAYDAGETNPSLNVVANAFVFVPGTAGAENDAIVFERGPDEGNVFFADNLVPAGEGDDVSTGPELAVPKWASVTQYPVADLGTAVVPAVGTHYPTAAEVARLEGIAAAI